MKRVIYIALTCFLSITLLSGCKDNNTVNIVTNDKLTVISTIFPGYDFAREIAGDRVNLSMLLPPGSESHSFEPTPQDIIKIQNCDVFIYVGGESDTWIKGILDSMDTSEMTLIAMMDYVNVVEEEIKEGMEHEAEDNDRSEGSSEHLQGEIEYDEHVWTSPVNAMTITKAITDTLCNLDAGNEDFYRENSISYITQLEDLDASFREATREATHDTLIFGDRFPFRYLIDEYSLNYYAAFPGCSTETEASAKTVAFLISKVKAENIPVVFYIEFSNGKMADTICESTGAKKLLLHSCHNVTKSDFENGISYLDLMRRNVENLREAIS